MGWADIKNSVILDVTFAILVRHPSGDRSKLASVYTSLNSEKYDWPKILIWQSPRHEWHISKIKFKIFLFASLFPFFKKADIILGSPPIFVA